MPIDSPADFQAFYDLTVADLTAFVRRRTHPTLVEDVVAETYATAWRRRFEIRPVGPTGPPPAARASPPAPTDATAGTVTPGPSHHPARAWLFTVARHHLMAASRGRKRQQDLAVRLRPVTEQTTPDHAAGIGEQHALAAAWAALPDGDQEVLSLQLLDDLDGTAAAQVLGCSRAAYTMRLSRARRRLASELQRRPASTRSRRTQSTPLAPSITLHSSPAPSPKDQR